MSVGGSGLVITWASCYNCVFSKTKDNGSCELCRMKSISNRLCMRNFEMIHGILSLRESLTMVFCFYHNIIKNRFPQLTKSWNSIHWLSQPISESSSYGVWSQTPRRACDIVCNQVLYWSSISRSATLSSDGPCSTEICIQIPSAQCSRGQT